MSQCLRYVAHPDDFKRLNKIRRAMGIKPLDGADPQCPRGCIQIIIDRPPVSREGTASR